MPEVLPDGLRLGKPLGDDVTGSGESFLDGTNLVSDIFPGLDLRISHLNLPHPVGQRLQTFLFRHCGTGSPLRPVRQIKILQLTGHHAVLYLGTKFVSQFALI